MKIAIDVTRAIIESAGIGRYTFELAHALVRDSQECEFLIYSTHFNDSAEKTERFESFARKNVKLKRLKIPGKCKEFWWGIPLNILGRFLEDADVLFAPSFFEVQLGLKIPQVVTIHDMATFIFPEQRGRRLSKYLSKRTVAVCKKAKSILSVSDSTKRDIVKYLKLSEDLVHRTYPGLNELSEPSISLPLELEQKQYILCVGTVEPRKNLGGLFKAYVLLPEDVQRKYKLVVCGGKGWNDSEIYELAKPLVDAKKLVFTGFVSDRDLAKLYEDAFLFIYPSLYEGFGLPVIEAMSFGLPVVTSNISSMPEAAGDAGLLIDPSSPKSISDAMLRIMEEDQLRKKMSRQSLQQSQKFSWRTCARETLRVIEDATEGR